MLKAIMARFSATAVMVAPDAQDSFEACLEALASVEHAQEIMGSSVSMVGDDFWSHPDDWRSHYRPYNVVNGVLQIPVRGVLMHDFPWQLGSWATGYHYIYKAVERGMSDPEVTGIAFLIHSPGGEVAGNFDLVERLEEFRGVKPMRAFAHEFAYSAAYNIAAVADHIVMSRTGGVGSIGVITSHVDISKALDEAGVKVTFIYAGKHKKDGNPYEPLPEDVRGRIQARVDSLYSDFVSAVARNRSMSEEAVRGTEALTFIASEATSNGLADSIGSLDDAMAAFVADLSQNQGDEQMSKQTDSTAVNQAAIDEARAEGVAEGREAGLAEGRKEGATAERGRISAILASDEGKARPAAALAAAMDTDLSVEQASAFLAKLPEEKQEESATTGANGSDAFAAAMEKTGNPDVGSGGDESSEAATADDASNVLSLASQMGLPGLRKRKAS